MDEKVVPIGGYILLSAYIMCEYLAVDKLNTCILKVHKIFS